MKRKVTQFENLLFVFFVCFTLSVSYAKAQYEKNPLLSIVNDGYNMFIKEFVNIPNDSGKVPRINCMAFQGNRFFASTEQGKIYEIIDNGNNAKSPELFFDVSEAIPINTNRKLVFKSNSFHSGLRSFAFHPDFKTNGKLYTSVMEERPTDTTGHHYISDASKPIEADGVVIEWTYDFNKKAVDPSSYREVFRVGTPYFDHTIKEIAFNRYAKPGDEDYGLLYIGHGDGYVYNKPAEGGLINNALGKILRINPLKTDTTPYSIPSTNPFVNDTNWLDEIYALGLRNPHTLCFAKTDSGKVVLISSNPGRDNVDEINIIKPGENYGWSKREGTFVTLQRGGLNTGIEALPDTDAVYGYTYPAAQWSRIDPVFSGFTSFSIAGGYIYTIQKTGKKIYLSTDFPQSGYIMYNDLNELLAAKTKLDTTNPNLYKPEDLTQAPFKLLNIYFDNDNDSNSLPVKRKSMLEILKLDPNYDKSGRSDIRFGQDSAENIYISNKRNGWIYKIESIKLPEQNSVLTANSEVATNVYPNPISSSGTLHISLNQITNDLISIQILTADGRSILNEKIPSGVKEFNLNIGNYRLKQGYYILKVTSKVYNNSQGIIIK
jgi:hypothetical protein